MERLAEITTSQITQQRALVFVKWLSCLHVARTPAAATELFLERWPQSQHKDLVTKTVGGFLTTMDLEPAWAKAAVLPGSTTDPAWAGALTTDTLAEAFFDVLRRASLLGRIPGLRHVPLHAKVPTLETDCNYVWVGQGQPKPISRFSFADGVTLGATKATGTVVTSDELAKVAVPGMEGLLRDLLTAGITGFTDRQFLDPAVAVVPDVHPPSITNGLIPIAGTGDLVADLGALIAALVAGRPTTETIVVLMAPGTALSPKDVPFGVTVVTSPAAAGMLVALDPRGVFVADTGVRFDVTREALLQMDDAPVSPATPAVVLTSLWQNNLAGFRVERFVNWQPLAGAVQYLTLGAPVRSRR